MGPLSTCFSQPLPEIRNPKSRFSHFQGVIPSSKICCMETRSLQHSHGAMSFPWTQGQCYPFPQFCLIPHVLSTIQLDQIHTVTLIKPCRQTKLWYPQVLRMLIRRPILIPSWIRLLVDHKRSPHPLVLNKTRISLVIWQISCRHFFSSEFLRKQPSLLPSQESKVLWDIKNRPERSGMAAMTHGKLIHFDPSRYIMKSFYTEQ